MSMPAIDNNDETIPPAATGKANGTSKADGEDKTDKAFYRRTVRERLAALSPAERADDDARLIERARLYTRERYPAASLFLVYAPLPDEPALTPLYELWRADGFRLAFPCSLPAEEGKWRGEARGEGEWKAAFFEPSPAAPWPSSSLPCLAGTGEGRAVGAGTAALILMPGRAFTPRGDRLGRGGGWYDRWLSGLSADGPFRLALAYDEQIFDRLPLEAHDLPVHHLITPTGGFPGGAH